MRWKFHAALLLLVYLIGTTAIVSGQTRLDSTAIRLLGFLGCVGSVIALLLAAHGLVKALLVGVIMQAVFLPPIIAVMQDVVSSSLWAIALSAAGIAILVLEWTGMYLSAGQAE